MIAISSPDGNQLESFGKSEGIRTISVPMSRHISVIKDFQSLILMIRVLHKEKPDIVHSMTPKAGMISMMAAWLTRVPIRIHTFTGLVWPTSSGLKRIVLKSTDRITCACATHIIPEGEGVKDDLIKGKITSKQMSVLGYGNVRGIDLNYYAMTPDVIEESLKLKREGFFTFLYVGRIVADKGIKELVCAFKKFSDNDHVRLLLVGPYEEALDPLDYETKVSIQENDRIIRIGAQEDVRPYYAVSDCFVLPSYREGFPNTVLEAGAMGLPSIVTDINGSREIIDDGYNGLIVPPRDEISLYKAMASLLSDSNTRSKMAEHARESIASRFEQGFVRKCQKDYYNQICD